MLENDGTTNTIMVSIHANAVQLFNAIRCRYSAEFYSVGGAINRHSHDIIIYSGKRMAM